MSKVSITRSLLDDLAMSISAKSGEAVPMTLTEMKDAVDSIQTGGGGSSFTPVTVTITSSYSGDKIMGPTYSPDSHAIGIVYSTGSWSASGFPVHILYDQTCADATGVCMQYVSTNSHLIITPENNVEVGETNTIGNCTFYNICILGDNAAFSVGEGFS